MRLLDTNHCSLILDGEPQVLAHLAEHAQEGFCISIIVHGELEYMVWRSQHRERNRQRLDDFVADIDVFGLDGPTAEVYGQLKPELFSHFGPKEQAARRRFTLASLGFTDNDLWIAATAIHNDLTIVSADTDFVRIQEIRPLNLETW